MFGDIEKINKHYGVGNGGWLKLEVGDNQIRIVSEFVDYGNHFLENAKTSVICTGADTCPICLEAIKNGKYQDNKPSVQFLGYVIDRKDAGMKLFRMGWGIFKDINDLSMKADSAFEGTPPYDIVINRVGTGKNDTRYKVRCARTNTPLTEDEMSAIADLKPIEDVIEEMKEKQGGETDKEDYESDPNAELSARDSDGIDK